MVNASIQQYFDRAALTYAQKSGRFAWKKLREAESREIEAALRGVRASKVLELGCGDGFYTSILRSWNPLAEITCIDLSEEMLARNLVPGIRKIHADIDRQEIEEKFDFVFCAGAMEFLRDPDAVAAKLRACLAPSGKMLLFFPRASLFGALYFLYHRVQSNRIRLFSGRMAAKFAGNGRVTLNRKVFPFGRLVLVEVRP